eukprot:COSAG01_NODE_1454_length_10256_cov_4.300748_12_plen_609_part_00
MAAAAAKGAAYGPAPFTPPREPDDALGAESSRASVVPGARLQPIDIKGRDDDDDDDDTPHTLESLGRAVKELARGQAELEQLIRLGLGKDADGHRAPPPDSTELACTLATMEDHGLDPEVTEQAHRMFELYDEDNSGTIDEGELIELLRYLGASPTREEVDELIGQVDENENGDLTLNEFLTIYDQVVTHGHGTTVDGKFDRSGVNLKSISDYGIYAMMRWVHHDADEVGGDVTGPMVPRVRAMARSLVLRRDLEYIFYLAIGLSAVSSGLNTFKGLADHAAVEWLGHFTMIAFFVEVLLKMVAELQSCGAGCGYFAHFWNSFDFFVLTSIGVLTPILENQDGTTALRCLRILRLARALRILRAAKILPRLMMVLETLLASVSSVSYIVAFMVLVSYVFAIVGVTVFGENDPFHFGDLAVSMLTLFRVASLEDWTDVMYLNIYGCKGWGDYAAMKATSTGECKHESFGFAAAVFFLLYVTLTTFLLLNLFVGVIVNSMMETKEATEKKKEEAKAWAVATRLKVHTGPRASALVGGAKDLGKGLASKGLGGIGRGLKRRTRKANGKRRPSGDGEVEFEQQVSNSGGEMEFDNPVRESANDADTADVERG